MQLTKITDLEKAIEKVFEGVYLGRAEFSSGAVKLLIYRPITPQQHRHFIYANAYLNDEDEICFSGNTYDVSWEEVQKEVETLRR